MPPIQFPDETVVTHLPGERVMLSGPSAVSLAHLLTGKDQIPATTLLIPLGKEEINRARALVDGLAYLLDSRPDYQQMVLVGVGDG